MKIEQDLKLDFKDVLIRPKRSQVCSRSEIDLVRTYVTMHTGNRLTGIPVIASNMDTIGTFSMARELYNHSMYTCVHKHYSVDKFVDEYLKHPDVNYIFYTMGVTNDDFSKVFKISDELKNRGSYIKNICIDVSNGYSQYFLDRVKRVREEFPHATIMAGNVVTPEMVQELLISGCAEIIKIGIGPGSCCTTRVKTGVGYPQLSAIIECADAAHGLGGLICADGGCTCAGDVAKAFGAGADFTMLGGMLAGHDECEGRWDFKEEEGHSKKYLRFYGMSSAEAMLKYNGGVADYKAEEGKSVIVPYKGPVKDTIRDILGGLRSACSFVGATRLKDLSKCTTFVRVSNQHNTIFGD